MSRADRINDLLPCRCGEQSHDADCPAHYRQSILNFILALGHEEQASQAPKAKAEKKRKR